jgi:hypothetical protein
MKKTQVFDWVTNTRQQQENCNNKQRWRESGLAMILAHRPEMNPHTMTRKLAYNCAYNWIHAYKYRLF